MRLNISACDCRVLGIYVEEYGLVIMFVSSGRNCSVKVTYCRDNGYEFFFFSNCLCHLLIAVSPMTQAKTYSVFFSLFWSLYLGNTSFEFVTDKSFPRVVFLF